MIDTEDLEFIGNVLHLQNNDSVDLTLLKSILSTIRDNPEVAHDIKDSFGRNQFAAKSLLIDLIDQTGCLDSESEVVIFGCWYGSVIIPKLAKRVKSIYGIDLDKQVIHIAKNKFWKDNSKVKLIEGDAFASFRKNYGTAKLFINTSCEHMPAMKDWPSWSKVNDNAYFAGYYKPSSSFGVVSEVQVLKVTTNGVLENSFGIGGVFRYSDPTAFLSFTDIVYRDGFLIGCGRKYSPSTNIQEAMLLKINSQGTIESSFGNSGLVLWDQDNTEFLSMAIDPSGRIVCLGGITSSGDEDLIVALFDENGDIQTDFGTAGATLPWDLNGGEDNPISLQLSNDGSGIFALGYGFSSSSGSVNGVPLSSGDYGFVLKYTLDQSAAQVDSKLSSKTFSISPNPVEDIIRVQSENSVNSYSISDISGKIIEKNSLNLKQDSLIEVSHLKAGLYFITIEFSDKTLHVQKIVVI